MPVRAGYEFIEVEMPDGQMARQERLEGQSETEWKALRKILERSGAKIVGEGKTLPARDDRSSMGAPVQAEQYTDTTDDMRAPVQITPESVKVSASPTGPGKGMPSFKGIPIGDIVANTVMQAAPTRSPLTENLARRTAIQEAGGPGAVALGQLSSEQFANLQNRSGATSATQAAQVTPALTPQPEAPPPQDLSGSLALSLMGSGPEAPGLYGPNTRELEAGIKAQQEALQREAAIAGERAAVEERLMGEKARSAADSEARAIAQQEELHRNLAEREKLMDKARADLENTETRVNPDAYWENKNAFQKVLFVIAAGLSGAQGGPNQAIATIQREIDRDVEAQKATIQATLAKRKELLGQVGESYNRARQLGMDDRAFENLLRAQKLDTIDYQLQQVAANFKGPDAKAKADVLGAALQTEKAKLKDAMQQDANRAALQKFGIEESAASRRDAMAMRLAAKGQGNEIKPGAEARIAAAKAGFKAVELLQQKLGPESSFAGAVWDEVTKPFPKTEANARAKEVEPMRRELIRLIDNSAIQKADAEYWKDKISGVGFSNLSQADLRGLLDWFRTMYTSELEVAGESGGDVSRFKKLPEPASSKYGKYEVK